ncbi:hypothetical protein PENSPDRAFT_659111 [Peniophora sp. CONT]|nr:hypothetical protein PENSPDRAFT_659111 [Peniophora sp. CONT]
MTGSDNEAQAPGTAYGVLPASDFYAGGADTGYSFIDAPAPHPSSTNANWFGTPPNLGFTHMASETSPVAVAAYNVPVTASSSSRGRSSSLFSEGQSGYSSSTAVNSRRPNTVDLAEVVNAYNSAGELPHPGFDAGSPAGPYMPRWPQKEPDGLWDDVKFSSPSSPTK